MRKCLVIVGVLLMLGGLVPAVGADTPAPGGPFNTAFRVQNLGGSPAHCLVEFYGSAGGTPSGSTSLPEIPVGQSGFVYVPNVVGLADGKYAAVISCDQDVAAVVNYSDPDSGASYSGVGAGEIADTLYAPGIYDNYYNYYSNVVVQNVSAGLNDITLDIYEAGNPTPVYSSTQSNVPANGFVSFEQEGLAQLNTNQPYSGKISGTGDIAAIVNQYGLGPVEDQLYSYNPFASGSTTMYAPLIMHNYYGYNTALVIQNMGGSTANVTITYGTGVVKNITIAPGAAGLRYTPNEGLGAGTLTGAKVECTNGQPLAVLVNESNAYNRASSYSGFAGGSTTARAPIVMKRYYKWNSSVTCQNIGSAAATMTVEYGGIATTTTSPSIPVDGTHLFYQPNELQLSDNWLSSATITSAQPIICVINQDQNEAPEATTMMDQMYAYNSIAQ
jgi:hypothetical protein